MICYRCNPGGVKPPISMGRLALCPHGFWVFASTIPATKPEPTPEPVDSDEESTDPVEVKRGPGRPRKAA